MNRAARRRLLLPAWAITVVFSSAGCCLQGLCYAGGLCEVPGASAAVAASRAEAGNIELARAPLPPRTGALQAY